MNDMRKGGIALHGFIVSQKHVYTIDKVTSDDIKR